MDTNHFHIIRYYKIDKAYFIIKDKKKMEAEIIFLGIRRDIFVYGWMIAYVIVAIVISMNNRVEEIKSYYEAIIEKSLDHVAKIELQIGKLSR